MKRFVLLVVLMLTACTGDYVPVTVQAPISAAATTASQIETVVAATEAPVKECPEKSAAEKFADFLKARGWKFEEGSTKVWSQNAYPSSGSGKGAIISGELSNIPESLLTATGTTAKEFLAMVKWMSSIGYHETGNGKYYDGFFYQDPSKWPECP